MYRQSKNIPEISLRNLLIFLCLFYTEEYIVYTGSTYRKEITFDCVDNVDYGSVLCLLLYLPMNLFYISLKNVGSLIFAVIVEEIVN